MDENYETLKQNLVAIGSELFRFQRVFEKVMSRLGEDDRRKYSSQYVWFAKRVYKALEDSNLRVINLEGEEYDPGMSVTPLNLDDFEVDESLYISQMMEPIIMEGATVLKTGTAILGRVEK